MSDASQGPRRNPAATGAPVSRGVLYAGGAVAALAVVYLGLAATGSAAVPAGTRVVGTEIGGLDYVAAVSRLQGDPAARLTAPITVVAAGQQFKVNPTGAGIRLDAEATVAAARAGSWAPGAVLSRFVGGRDIEPVIAIDQAKLNTAVKSIARRVDAAPVDGDVAMVGEGAELSSPEDGRTLDLTGSAAAITAAVLRGQSRVELSVSVTPPAIGRAEAERVFHDIALPALSEPITVKASTATATITPDQISQVLSFEPKDGKLEPIIDGARLRRYIAPDLASVEKPGRDATFVIRGSRPVVVPSVTGYGVSPAVLAKAVAPVLGKSGAERVAVVSLGRLEPTLTTAQAGALGITEVIGSFTQKYPYAEYRVKNVGQAAKFMDGTVLKPGDVYSMNDTIKERTAQNGYVTGIRIERGKFVEDIGGGVSIITTATWSAAFYSGLEKVEQRAHSLYISRYQPGLEATVAWGSLDLKFRNNTPNGVLITTRVTDTSVTVTMWGKKQYDDVRAVFGKKRDVEPFSKVYDTSSECKPQNGVDGFTIDVVRQFLKGSAVVKSDKFTTVYEPTFDVTCGPDPSGSPEPTSTQAPTTSGGSTSGGGSKPAAPSSPAATSKAAATPSSS